MSSVPVAAVIVAHHEYQQWKAVCLRMEPAASLTTRPYSDVSYFMFSLVSLRCLFFADKFVALMSFYELTKCRVNVTLALHSYNQMCCFMV